MPKEGPDHPPWERKILIMGSSLRSLKNSWILSFAFSLTWNIVASF
jgi:hypothetical protein